jgi:hypothetical protein
MNKEKSIGDNYQCFSDEEFYRPASEEEISKLKHELVIAGCKYRPGLFRPEKKLHTLNVAVPIGVKEDFEEVLRQNGFWYSGIAYSLFIQAFVLLRVDKYHETRKAKKAVINIINKLNSSQELSPDIGSDFYSYYKVITPSTFSDISTVSQGERRGLLLETMAEAQLEIERFGTWDEKSEYYDYWQEQKRACRIVRVTSIIQETNLDIRP